MVRVRAYMRIVCVCHQHRAVATPSGAHHWRDALELLRRMRIIWVQPRFASQSEGMQEQHDSQAAECQHAAYEGPSQPTFLFSTLVKNQNAGLIHRVIGQRRYQNFVKVNENLIKSRSDVVIFSSRDFLEASWHDHSVINGPAAVYIAGKAVTVHRTSATMMYDMTEGQHQVSSTSLLLHAPDVCHGTRTRSIGPASLTPWAMGAAASKAGSVVVPSTMRAPLLMPRIDSDRERSWSTTSPPSPSPP